MFLDASSLHFVLNMQAINRPNDLCLLQRGSGIAMAPFISLCFTSDVVGRREGYTPLVLWLCSTICFPPFIASFASCCNIPDNVHEHFFNGEVDACDLVSE